MSSHHKVCFISSSWIYWVLKQEETNSCSCAGSPWGQRMQFVVHCLKHAKLLYGPLNLRERQFNDVFQSFFFSLIRCLAHFCLFLLFRTSFHVFFRGLIHYRSVMKSWFPRSNTSLSSTCFSLSEYQTEINLHKSVKVPSRVPFTPSSSTKDSWS